LKSLPTSTKADYRADIMAQTSAPSFSYAQAAKGISSNPTSAPSSKVASGTITPAKESESPSTIPPQSAAIPTNIDTATQKPKENVSINTSQTEVHEKPVVQQKSLPLSNGSNSPASPAYVDSSISTLNREDDNSSVQLASSESTWENVSQTSHKEERPVENGVKSKKDQEGWVKVQKPVEAPVPSVNIWKQRMEAHGVTPRINGSHPAPSSIPVQDNQSNLAIRSKDGQSKKEDETKPKKSGGRKVSAEEKAQPPPAINDQSSWPTPELGLSATEERKKSDATKIQKVEKESKSSTKGKSQWKPVEIDHTAYQSQFHPNPNSRRGGRAAHRGGRDGNSRISPNGRNGNTDKRHGSPTSGDAKDKDAHGNSPDSKSKRFNSDNTRRDSKFSSPRDTDSETRINGKPEEDGSYKSQQNVFSRQKPARRSDAPFDQDRRKDSKAPELESDQPSTEASSTSPNLPSQEDDKRSSFISDSGASRFARGGANGYAGRGRGNVRGRGGHNFQSPATAPPFQPHGYGMVRTPSFGHHQYYAQPPNSRMRGNPRQNMPSDVYRYWSHMPPMVPPINTYAAQPGMYDYSPQQPMSATVYSPTMDESVKLGYLAFQL
jgi:la-related protein 1